MAEARESQKLYELNRVYQDILFSEEYQRFLKKEKIKKLLLKREIKQFLRLLRWRTGINKKKVFNTEEEYKECTMPGKKEKQHAKIVVYMCITGGYDTIKEPFYYNQNIDYILFTDMEVPKQSVWRKIDINAIEEIKSLNNSDKNRFIKMFPHKFFSNYDYSIYVDGVVEIITDMFPVITEMGDCILGVHRHNYRNCVYAEAKAVLYSQKATKEKVKEQIQRYKKEGYPENNGLYENTILARKHNQKLCIELMEVWWEEYMRSCKRDQLSLPYVIWKLKLDKKNIYILGNNLDCNPRFRRKTEHGAE